MINLQSKIYVAGHKGLVGSAILRQLKKKGYKKKLQLIMLFQQENNIQ